MKQSIVVFAGPPLAGKSTLAGLVAQKLRCPHLEMDEARLAILPTSNQSPADRDTAYRAVHYAAGKLLEAGTTLVILCATYGPAVHREGVRDLARRFSTRLFVVSCLATLEEAVSRYRQRPSGHAAVDLTEDKIRRLATEAKPFTGGLITNTSEMTVEVAVAQVIAYVTSGAEVGDVDAWVQMGFRGRRI